MALPSCYVEYCLEHLSSYFLGSNSMLYARPAGCRPTGLSPWWETSTLARACPEALDAVDSGVKHRGSKV